MGGQVIDKLRQCQQIEHYLSLICKLSQLLQLEFQTEIPVTLTVIHLFPFPPVVPSSLRTFASSFGLQLKVLIENAHNAHKGDKLCEIRLDSMSKR